MADNGKLRRALRLYPLYEAASGDLLFFSVIQMLFLTQVKGFSAEQVAAMVLITDTVDLALEYPTYRIIRRIGNSRACVVGGLMPWVGIVLITFGHTLPLIAFGNALFVSAGNFQSMAGAAARNNLVLLGEKDDYAKLFSRGGMIYSVLSMVAAVLAPFLFSVNRYAPSVLCIIAYGLVAAISFLICDYSEQGGPLPASRERKGALMRVGRGLRLLVVVFCLFFCAGAVFSNNAELFLGNSLAELFSQRETIYLYGAVLWAVRVLRLGSNVLLPKVVGHLKENIVVVASAVMVAAFASVGVSGLAFGGTALPPVVAGVAYMVVKGVAWDPLRTYLRMAAVDTSNKRRQQTMLVLLNAGQSVVSILMDLVVVGILRVFSLECVFLAFAGISTLTVVFSVLFRGELVHQTEVTRYEGVLNEGEIDEIAQTVFDDLRQAGMRSDEALSYRLLTEEKLLERMRAGDRGADVSLRIVKRLDDYHVLLYVRGEERDIFMLPENVDEVSERIFHSIMRGL